MRSRVLLFLAAVSSYPPASLAGQAVSLPPGWDVAADGSGLPGAGLAFATMPPGWHLTTGSGVTVYNGMVSAEGRFALESEMILFPGASTEGYGLFLGGHDLGTSTPSWTAVLLRRDGAVSVERHDSTGTKSLLGWTPVLAAKPQRGEAPTGNVLRVIVERDSLRIDVNGARAAALAAPAQPLDGAFGFRIGSNLNLHITTLSLLRHYAPPRGAR